jgi:hypothetical protein
VAFAGPAAALPAPAVAAPAYPLEERARAVASPSLVYLETVYTGYLRDKASGALLFASPIVYNRRCSGFVVDPAGHVVTTAQCAVPGPDRVREAVLAKQARVLVSERKLDQAKQNEWVAANRDTTAFTGAAAGSAPETRLLAQVGVATGAVTESPAVPFSHVTSRPETGANLALVKIDGGGLPAVELHPAAAPAAGAPLLLLGFETTDADPRVGTYLPRAKEVRVVREFTRGDLTLRRVDDELGPHSPGGMAVDTRGRVVGVIDVDPGAPNRPSRALVPAAEAAALLADAGVRNTLSATDRSFRDGLDAYFSGRYAEAVSQLDAVARRTPANQVAREYQQRAADRRAIEGDGRPLWLTVLLGLGALVTVAGLAAGVFVLMYRQARRRELRAAFRPPTPRYEPEPPAPPHAAPAPPPRPAPYRAPPAPGPPAGGWPPAEQARPDDGSEPTDDVWAPRPGGEPRRDSRSPRG